MDKVRPVILEYEERAIDALVNIFNEAKFRTGLRLSLTQLATSRNEFLSNVKMSLHTLKSPLAKSCEKLIVDSIEKKWNLAVTFQFIVRYMGSSTDETSHFLYYEAIFSQPTAAYPIPQATVSVFFRVEDKHLEPPQVERVPQMWFRIEGDNTDHDVRYVFLPADWILAVLKMKIKLFERIEALRLF